MVLVVQPSDADADDDAAEDAHLKRQDAAARRNRAFEHRGCDRAVREDLPADLQHGVARRVHDEEGDHGRKRPTSFSAFAMPMATPTAKMIGRLPKIVLPALAMMERSA